MSQTSQAKENENKKLLNLQHDINDLKKIIKELDLKFPKKGTNEYLFISPQLKDLYYTLFDLDHLKIDSSDLVGAFGPKIDFFVLVQQDEDGKLYHTIAAENYDKIYFYPWLDSHMRTQEEKELLQRVFVKIKKCDLF